MNIFALLTRSREPRVIVRHVAATKAESRKAATKREETTAKLRRIVTEQKLLAAVEKAVGR